MRPDPLDWLLARLPEAQGTNAADFLYDRMASQSGHSLPIIYQPFDGRLWPHFVDWGQILDFALVTGPGRVLDFGPGDGWPSLSMAPLVSEVVGVDASPVRVAVCQENAARLGVENARFVHVAAGEPLPFAEASFDGLAAASAIEQTPDPQATLRELARVLKPGGKLRLRYESLGRYRNGRERELELDSAPQGGSSLLLYERDIEGERARHLCLILDAPPEQIRAAVAPGHSELAFSDLDEPALGRLLGGVVQAGHWITQHPSCRTWLKWLREAGFSRATPTEDGGQAAARIFNALDPEERPREREAVHALLEGAVRRAIERRRPCPLRPDAPEPAITAVR